jgi:hypothetical protein
MPPQSRLSWFDLARGGNPVNPIASSSSTKPSRNGVSGALQPPHFPEQFAGIAPTSNSLAHTTDGHGGCAVRCTRADYLRFLVVAFYLVGVLFWLLLTRQLRLNFSVRRTLLAVLLQGRGLNTWKRHAASKESNA